jgi:hypothetical protein
LKAAFRYVALWNIKTGYFLSALVQAGYLKEHHQFSRPTAEAIEILRQDVGEDYTFSGISARLTDALIQDELRMMPNGTPDSSLWAGMNWEWHLG